ncbi:tripartite tricarboxylate transporter TctB family protein [Rhodospirillaceae bacterium SYSU D60014]|uniref:tripartite tricarboxylate transporter TctB family protein n=1 Tax=Virgifigura deserti TaxID=2268457 RepID=UPI0013C3E8F7
MRADRATGIATVAAGIGLGLASLQIETLVAPGLSARFFPLLLSLALIGLGAVLAIRPGERTAGDALRQMLARRAVLLAGLLLLYFLSFPYVDFRVGTWLFMLLAMMLLGSRRPLELAAVPIAVSFGVYFLFRYGFTVLLPVWI